MSNTTTAAAAMAQALAAAQKELAEERLHTARIAGFTALARQETVCHVLSLVRRGISHRLDNIRGFADRENPDREEILSLVSEVEQYLAAIENKLA